MTAGPVLVELCAGTASVSLWALGRGQQLVGYMGSKRRLAPTLCELLGVDRQVPDQVVLVDAGPWGDAWSVLQDRERRRAVAALLRSWGTWDPHDLWQALVAWSPPDDPIARVAQYLWLQARSAGTIPIWWNADRGRWESPTGARTESAHARGGMGAASRGTTDERQKQRAPNRPYEAGSLDRRRAVRGGVAVQKGMRDTPHSLAAPCEVDSSAGKIDRVLALRADGEVAARWRAGCRGIQYTATVAARIEALDRLPWERVVVVHGPVESFDPIRGSTAYVDPPYAGCPRYACLLPRAAVLELAQRHAGAGARVLVSEGEPLPLEGWSALALPARKAEWVTASWPIRAPQLDLFSLEVACR